MEPLARGQAGPARRRSGRVQELERATAAAGDAADDAAADGQLRTVDAARANKAVRKHGPLQLLSGAPLGPWASSAALLEEWKVWARDPATGGGAFSIVPTSVNVGTKSHGAQRVYRCSRYTSAKGKCPWCITTEPVLLSDGAAAAAAPPPCAWIILYASSLEHNHPLPQTRAVAIAEGSIREVPEWALSEIPYMVRAGLGPAAIHKLLVEKAADMGKMVTWVVKDIQYRVHGAAGSISFDSTGFLELLQERKLADSSLYFNFLTGDGSLEGAFFVVRGGFSALAQSLPHSSAQFDVTVRARSLSPGPPARRHCLHAS